MSLSIAASRVAQTAALDSDASSMVLYDGHAGLGAQLMGPAAESSVGAGGASSDEVLVSFKPGEPRLPCVIGSLWNSSDQPPSSSAESSDPGATPTHRHLAETARHRGGT